METKKAYIEKIEAQLKVWDAELQKLSAKANMVQVRAKAELENQLRALREQRGDAAKKLNNLKEKGEEAWSELRTGLEQAWKELREGLDRARTKFK